VISEKPKKANDQRAGKNQRKPNIILPYKFYVPLPVGKIKNKKFE